MAKRKKSSKVLYLIDLYQLRVTVRPLYGLNRLVKIEHGKRSGIMHCATITNLWDSIAFSDSNKQTSPYTISFGVRNPGALSEPRLNVPNEVAQADLERFSEDGTEAVFRFTPQGGQTYSAQCNILKPVDTGNRVLRTMLPDDAKIGIYSVTLDLSAYVGFGFSVEGPRCEYEVGETNGKHRNTAHSISSGMLSMTTAGEGVWNWSLENVTGGGAIRLMWETNEPNQARALKSLKLDRLATELSVNPRLAKDLHNFVSICHHFAAGIRSLNKIGPAMITNRSVVNRSLETVEEILGAELIHRTQGKGLIAITPAGHAVLDWWSQFYMRWTPISSEVGGPQQN